LAIPSEPGQKMKLLSVMQQLAARRLGQ